MGIVGMVYGYSGVWCMGIVGGTGANFENPSDHKTNINKDARRPRQKRRGQSSLRILGLNLHLYLVPRFWKWFDIVWV